MVIQEGGGEGGGVLFCIRCIDLQEVLIVGGVVFIKIKVAII